MTLSKATTARRHARHQRNLRTHALGYPYRLQRKMRPTPGTGSWKLAAKSKSQIGNGTQVVRGNGTPDGIKMIGEVPPTGSWPELPQGKHPMAAWKRLRCYAAREAIEMGRSQSDRQLHLVRWDRRRMPTHEARWMSAARAMFRSPFGHWARWVRSAQFLKLWGLTPGQC